MKLKVEIEFFEDVLASSPANPDVYREFIAKQQRDLDLASGKPDSTTDEVKTLPIERMELAGWSVFHQDDKGIFIFDYHVKGFFKAAAEAVTGKALTAYRSKIDKWLFIQPRRIYFERQGNTIPKPEGVSERPVRAMTMQGPRVSLKRSDKIEAGAKLSFTVKVFPLGEKEMTAELLQSWLDYGQYSGLSEWRGGGYGRFNVLSVVEVEPPQPKKPEVEEGQPKEQPKKRQKAA